MGWRGRRARLEDVGEVQLGGWKDESCLKHSCDGGWKTGGDWVRFSPKGSLMAQSTRNVQKVKTGRPSVKTVSRWVRVVRSGGQVLEDKVRDGEQAKRPGELGGSHGYKALVREKDGLKQFQGREAVFQFRHQELGEKAVARTNCVRYDAFGA